MTLKEKALDQTMCADLQKILKTERDLTTPKVQIATKFHHYKWERKVKDPKAFRRALSKYQESHPDIDISSEDMGIVGPILQYGLYLLAIVGAIASVLAVV